MSANGFQHEDLFGIMPIPRLIVAVEDKSVYHIADINKKALDYFDKTKEQVLNKDFYSFLNNEHADHFVQSFEVCVNKKQTVTIQALPGFPGNVKFYGFLISPVLDDDGQVVYLDVIAQPDAMDQSILQRERDDAISLLTSVFDASEIGIVVSDPMQRIIRVNDAFIRTYGWSRSELINTKVSSLVTPDERDLAEKNHAAFIREGQRASGETKIIRKDGTVSNTLYTTATLELSQKRRFQVTTVMDITLRKQMEHSLRMAKDQADSANRAKSTFLANMSHELRTPLNAIIGFSEMMINETFGAVGHPKYSEYLSDIHMSARHLLETINEVLDMSKIEAGRIELDEEMVDLYSLIKSVKRMMDSRAFEKDVEIKLDMPDDLAHIRADQRLMRQILINLVTNAVKFSKQGGEILLHAGVLPDGRLKFIVADQGVGIPKEKIEQAMEPFGQVADRAENTHHQGTGLGLPLAKAMVELHEGVLQLESELGAGTTVIVHIPEHRVFPRERLERKHGNGSQEGLALS